MWLRVKAYSIAALACFIVTLSIGYGSYATYNHFSGPTLEYHPNCTINPDVTLKTCHKLFGNFPKKFIIAQMQFDEQTFHLCSFNDIYCKFDNTCALEEYNSALEELLLLNQSQCWIDRLSSKMYLTDYHITDRQNYQFAISMIVILLLLFVATLLCCLSKHIFERHRLQIHNGKDNLIFGEYSLKTEQNVL